MSKLLLKNRVEPLDILRGVAIVGMILVVSPGSWAHRYPFLSHAEWHGYTLADVVFPIFLFAVGSAMAYGYPLKSNTTLELRRIFRRTTLLIVLGLLLNLLPNFDITNLRIPGILQRIAVCYALAATLLLYFSKHGDIGQKIHTQNTLLFICLILIGWGLVLKFTSAPGYPTGNLSEAGTLAAWVDRQLFTTAHLWAYGADADGNVVYDPEGLLASLPATTNVLIGVLITQYLGRNPSVRLLLNIALAGIAMIGLAHALEPVMIINKRIWTPTFSLVSSGWAILTYCAILLLFKIRKPTTLFWVFKVLGSNATLAFILSQILASYAYVQVGNHSIQSHGYNMALMLVNEPRLASTLCAFGILGVITLLIWPLSRKQIYMRV